MGAVDWLRTQTHWRDEPGLWLLGSLVLLALVSNAGWLMSKPQSGRLATWTRALRAWPALPWLTLLIRWIYLVAPPYALLVLGTVSPQTMGLADVDWAARTVSGLLLGATALLLLLLGWCAYRRGTPEEASPRPVEGMPGPLRWPLAAVEAAALQMHWSFFRAGLGELGWPCDPYWAAWAGLLLVGIEWTVNPWTRHALRRPLLSEPLLRRAVLAVVTTSLFVLTGNLWLCWALHAVFEATTGPIGLTQQRR